MGRLLKKAYLTKHKIHDFKLLKLFTKRDIEAMSDLANFTLFHPCHTWVIKAFFLGLWMICIINIFTTCMNNIANTVHLKRITV
jgi:hypothetical protein